MSAIRLPLLALALIPTMSSAAYMPSIVPRTTSVRDIHGQLVRPLAVQARVATVLIFIAHDCPISNAYGAEIARLRTDYGVGHIAFYVVYTDTGIPMATLRAHASAHGYTSFALFDTTHTLVNLTGATVTPEAVAVGPQGRILYEGRIDNRFADFGLSRDVASVSDLRRALNAIRLGRSVSVARTQAIGCAISGT